MRRSDLPESPRKEGKSVKINLIEEKCCSVGLCVDAAPEVFDQRDDDGVAILLEANPPDEQREAAREAARVCPTAAIVIDED